MKIWLDDERRAPDASWIRVHTAIQAIRFLTTGKVTEISLDHDLGLIGETGYDVIVWIERMVHSCPNYKPPMMYVHTDNPPARIRMIAAIESILRFIKDDREEILV